MATCCWPDCDAERGGPVDALPMCERHALHSMKVAMQAMRATVAAGRKAPGPRASGYVYFIRFRDRIKIGYSENPNARLGNLPVEDVLAITPGTMADEHALHAQFAHLRTVGEWFETGEDLMRYIQHVKSQGLSVPRAASARGKLPRGS